MLWGEGPWGVGVVLKGSQASSCRPSSDRTEAGPQGQTQVPTMAKDNRRSKRRVKGLLKNCIVGEPPTPPGEAELQSEVQAASRVIRKTKWSQSPSC